MTAMLNPNRSLLEKNMEIDSPSISSESSDSEDVPPIEVRLRRAEVVIPRHLADLIQASSNTVQENNDTDQNKVEEGDSGQVEDGESGQVQPDYQGVLREFLGKEETITKPGQVKTIVRAMKKFKTDDDRSFLLRILTKVNDVAIWKEFYAQNGLKILLLWASSYGLSNDQNGKMMLRTIRKLPYDANAFAEAPIYKFVTNMVKKGSTENRNIASIILDEVKRKTANDSEKKSNIKETLKRPKEEALPAVKKVKVDDSVKKVEEKKPAYVSTGGNNIFQMLNTKPTPSAAPTKLKLSDLAPVKKKESPVLIPRPKSSTDISPLDALLPSNFERQPSPVRERVPTISKKTGKPKKIVSFKPESEITKVVFFDKDDAPSVVATGKPSEEFERQQEMYASMQLNEPQIPFLTPRAIRLPKLYKCEIYSPEAEYQARREMEVLSVQYLHPRDIPPSPAEPEDSYEPPRIPMQIPLDRPGAVLPSVVPQIAHIPPAALNTPLPPYLSTLLAQQPIYVPPSVPQWNQLPVSNPNPVNVPIPAVFQQSKNKYQPYNGSRGQPSIPSRGRSGNSKPHRGRH